MGRWSGSSGTLRNNKTPELLPIPGNSLFPRPPLKNGNHLGERGGKSLHCHGTLAFKKKKRGPPPLKSECTECKLWRRGSPLSKCRACASASFENWDAKWKPQEAVEVGLVTPIAEPTPLSPRETSRRTGVENYERVYVCTVQDSRI